MCRQSDLQVLGQCPKSFTIISVSHLFLYRPINSFSTIPVLMHTHNRLCTCLLMRFVTSPSQISPALNSQHSGPLFDIHLTFPKASTYAPSPACNSEAYPLPQVQSGDIITTPLCDLVRGRTFHTHTHKSYTHDRNMWWQLLGGEKDQYTWDEGRSRPFLKLCRGLGEMPGTARRGGNSVKGISHQAR